MIRPEKGIDKSQFQPIIRKNRQLNIALSPLRVSSNVYATKQPKDHHEVVNRKLSAVEIEIQSQEKIELIDEEDSQVLKTGDGDSSKILLNNLVQQDSQQQIDLASITQLDNHNNSSTQLQMENSE